MTMPTPQITQYILEFGYPNWHPDYGLFADSNRITDAAMNALTDTAVTLTDDITTMLPVLGQLDARSTIITKPNLTQTAKLKFDPKTTHITQHETAGRGNAVRRAKSATVRPALIAARMTAMHLRTLYGSHGLLPRLDAQAYAMRQQLRWHEEVPMSLPQGEFTFTFGYDTFITVYAADAEGNEVTE